MITIPQTYLDLLKDETRALAFLGTIMQDGSPQVTPLWFNMKENQIWINSAKGGIKDKNMRRQPHVALAIPDPKNPYRYVQIRGKVVEYREETANDHLDELSMKYTGKPYFETSSQTRVIFIIEPSSISGKE
jgi:PPOX class probable F420-dependent enzyme